MATKKTKKKKSSKFKLAATIVAAAATGYYLYGPKAKENSAKIKAWTVKAKGEVLGHFERRRDINEDQYKEIVDTVTKKYAKLKTVGETEAAKLNRELKRHWKAIKSGVSE